MFERAVMLQVQQVQEFVWWVQVLRLAPEQPAEQASAQQGRIRGCGPRRQ